MGQRHQLFLVARVRKAASEPKEYRCVAAFHHQWCYGQLPLRCVARFKHLARVKENAYLIQRDLDRYPQGVQVSSRIPCPYISFLARGAFSTDNDCEHGAPYASGIIHLPASMGSMDGDNNDGITVIDVSAPSEPTYCFVRFRGLRGPMSAMQYLRVYYPAIFDPLASENAQKEDAHPCLLKAVKDLDDMEILSMDVLAATWPHEYGLGDSGTGKGDEIVASPAPPDKPTEPANTSHGTRMVDLSWRDISATQLLGILRVLKPFRRLNISYIIAVDIKTFATILREYRLEWINIDGCSIPVEDLVGLLKLEPSLFRGVEAIIHPAFLSLDNLKSVPIGIPSAFRFYYGSTNYITLPFFSTDQLVQILIDVVQLIQGLAGDLQLRSNLALESRPALHNLQHSFGCLPRDDGLPWGRRAIQAIPLLTQGRTYPKCYSFIFVGRDQWKGGHQPRKGSHYGVILPRDERQFVSITVFLEHLEKEGWPKPKNLNAVEQLLELFSEKMTLLEDFDETMDMLGFEKRLSQRLRTSGYKVARLPSSLISAMVALLATVFFSTMAKALGIS